MHLRPGQLLATARVLPHTTSLGALASVAGASVLVCAIVSEANLVFQMRLAGAVVAAASAGLLDDPAALTLAPSPTSLVIRRSFRAAIVTAIIAAWWSVVLVIAAVRGVDVATTALTREVVVLSALALAGALAAQRLTGDGRGAAAGGFVAVGWFVLSFIPRVPWIPLPPDALSTSAAGPLAVVALVAVAAALALSRDPAARRAGLSGPRT